MPDIPILAEIYMGGMNFAPRGYALCQGQLLSIAQNTALFSLLGTSFGGDGRVTFGLPDLRGRVPVGLGQGVDLTDRALGESAGEENTTLTGTQMPTHTHSLTAINQAGDTAVPTNAYLANTGVLDKEYKAAGPPVFMNNGSIGFAGGNQPHNNMPPYLVLTFYIALEGIFPSRD